jgi:ATP-binding cassette subfamily B protein RaxB
VTALNADVALQRFEITTTLISSTISLAEKIVIAGIAAFLVSTHSFTIGSFIAAGFLSLQFSTRSRNLLDYLFQLKLLQVQQGRLADIIRAKQEPNFHSKYVGRPQDMTIKLTNVNFRYNTADLLVIKNLSLNIDEGEFVAIIGPSGIGKSTLISLITGVLAPSSGSITIGGIGLDQFGKSKYRELVAVALQDSGLFSGSIAENISMFDELATYDKIESAARAACALEDVMAKPMGFNTQLGGIESHLSAGQRQKIILARALYRNPSILILDEATCHMDSETESEVLQTIRDLKITRIMVTHRPSAAMYAGRIFDLHSGTIVHDRALAVNSR